ncbi:hypothetical protein WD019_20875, partial [Fictibacillus sp. Mic-4]
NSKKPGATQQAIFEGFTIKKGDILITDATSLYGLTGHAAIATTDNYILDAPGYKIQTSRGMKKTTRQSKVKDWLNQYNNTRGGTVWVYRVSSKYSWVANAAADWADRHYYSSTGSATQNIFPSYGINLYTKDTDPTYCSKIVYQAYYYGSSNLPFMVPVAASIIGPYGLIDHFEPKYQPKLVKVYR